MATLRTATRRLPSNLNVNTTCLFLRQSHRRSQTKSPSSVSRPFSTFSSTPYSPLRQNPNRNHQLTHTKPRRHYVSAPGAPKPPTKNRNNEFKVLPFVLIFAAGSGSFYLILKQRQGTMPAISEQPRLPMNLPSSQKKKPEWTPDQVDVVFVLGGPGVGKGTQCAKLVKDYGFVHLSAGDLLRAEQQRPGSEYGDLIKSYITEGKIVPMEVTIALLRNAMSKSMKSNPAAKPKFLIDGFPRQMDQATAFERDVVESRFTLFFDADEDVMMSRLMERGKTSGRDDDNEESIKKRFRTFKETSYPVVSYFQDRGKVVKVDATKTKDQVYGEVQKSLKDRLTA